MIFGWLLYGIVAVYALSGALFIVRAARVGGVITKMGLFRWAVAVACLILFALNPWNKLHLLWVVPSAFILSLTPLGMTVGQIVGVITALPFGAKRRQQAEGDPSNPEPPPRDRIPNAELRPEDIPPVERWVEFATSYQGYAHRGLDGCIDVANAALSHYEKHGQLPEQRSLDDLRACLYFEARRWGLSGGPPDERYIRALLDAIGAEVAARP